MNWLITQDANGYRIIDNDGVTRGCYRSANELAMHLAFALRALDALRHQMATDQFFARLGQEQPNV